MDGPELDLLRVYIRESAFILVPTLYFIILFLKNTPRVPEWSHIWIALVFSILACCFYYGWEIQSVVQGILTTGAAAILHRLSINDNDLNNKGGNGK